MTDTSFRPLRQTVLSDDFTRLPRHEFELKRRDGTWQYMDREVYERGNGATCLLYDGDVVLTRQFRMAAQVATGDGMMIETPAGHLDGMDAETRMRAELEEETGYRVGPLEHLYDLHFSPGSVAGNQACFLGRFSRRPRGARWQVEKRRRGDRHAAHAAVARTGDGGNRRNTRRQDGDPVAGTGVAEDTAATAE